MFRLKSHILNFTEFFCEKSGSFPCLPFFGRNFWHLSLLFSLLITGLGYSQSVYTVDADGGANYVSLDAVLSAIQAGTIDPDTVKFIGSDQDSYTWSYYVDKSIGSIVFKSILTDPDKFPILTLSSINTYNFFNVTNAQFQNIILTGATPLNLGLSSLTFSFKNCVFRDFTGTSALYVQGTGGTILFENCLFEGNTCTDIFGLNYWGGTPTFTIRNCTFDNNNSIWSVDEDQYTNFSLVNCIFSNNGTTFRGNNLRSKTTYSLTSESLTGYGTGCVSNSNPQYAASSRNNPSDWDIGGSSPAKNIGTSTGAPATDISYFTRVGNPDAGCYEAGDYTWDIDANPGILAGSGTWGTNNYWTTNGTSLVAWPGTGNGALFAGSDGSYAITVSGTQNVATITFTNTGYTVSGGTLNFGTNGTITTTAAATIGSAISGSSGLTKSGAAQLLLSGSNTFSGGLTVSGGILKAGSTTAFGDTGNSITVSSGAAIDINALNLQGYNQNIIINGQVDANTGALINTGADQLSAIRQIALGSDASIGCNNGRFDIGRNYTGNIRVTGNNHTLTKVGSNEMSLLADGTGLSAVIINGGSLGLETNNSVGSAPITVNSGAKLTFWGTRTFTNSITVNNGQITEPFYGFPAAFNGPISITGTATLNNPTTGILTFGGVISGSGGISKTGTGPVVLSGANTYTGTTSVSAGTLTVNGSTASGSAVSVSSGATLAGTGTVSGAVTVSAGGIIAPGDGGAGTLKTGNLILNGTSILNYDLGTARDSIKVTGTLTLDGTLNITNLTGFAAGNYTLFTTTSTITNQTLVVGTAPSGYTYAISVGANSVTLTVTANASASMILRYKFDENSGTTVYDSSGNAKNGTLVNGPVFLNSFRGYSIDLDGTDDYVQLPTGIVSGCNDITVSAWVKLDTIKGWTRIFDFGNTSTTGYIELAPYSTSSTRFAISTGTYTDEQGFWGAGIALHMWKHVVLRLAGDSAQLFLDGAVATTATGITLNPSTLGNTANNFIGKSQYSGDYYFDGTMEDFRIYNYALPPSEIANLYNSTKPKNFTWDTSLVAGYQPNTGTWGTNNYWSPDGYALMPWYGAGNTATFTGTAYTVTVNGTQNVDSIAFLSNYTLNSGTLDFGTNNAILTNTNIIARVNSVITGSGGLVKSGTGELQVAGDNTFTGTCDLKAGKLKLLHANALGSTSDGTIVESGAALIPSGTITFASEQLTINGTGIQWPGALRTGNDGITDNLTWQGKVTLGSNSTIGAIESVDQFNMNGIIEGAYQLTNDGAGIIVMSGTNTFSGGFIINAGITKVNNNQSLGNFGNSITINSGAVLDINGRNLQSYTQAITINGQKDASTGALINSGTDAYSAIRQIALGSDASIGSNNNRFDIGRNYTNLIGITGNNHTLTKVGSNHCALLAHGSGLSGVIINGGKLELSADDAVGTAAITINSGAQLCSYGSRTFTNSITMNSGAQISTLYDDFPVIFNGPIAITGSTTIQNTTPGTSIFNGIISGSGSITKNGSGPTVLSAANSYTGTTTVSQGTLIVNGSLAAGSDVTVNSGATLSGTGTVNDTVRIDNGGILSPGYNSARKFTTNTCILNNTSVLNFDLGAVSDTVAIQGNLVLDGILNIADGLGFSIGSYTLFTYTGSCTDNGLSINTVPSGFTYAITVGSNKVTLNISVPSKMDSIIVKHNLGTGTSDTCLVYTPNWSLVFDERKGGQIKFASNQSNGSGTNQVWSTDQRNLFSVEFNQGSYSVSGQLSIARLSTFFVVLKNTYTLNNVTFVEEYTVYGSGVIYVNVHAVNRSGSTQTQPLRFFVSRVNSGGSVRKTKTATASTCPYVLNAETSAGQFDILMATRDLWTDATGFINSAGNNSYLGYEDNSYTFTNNMNQTWDFMVDFSKSVLIDTSSFTNALADNHCSPDSLTFLAGTPAMERAWEHFIRLHWNLDDARGDTALDCSGNNRHATLTGTWTTSGKWGGALQVATSEKITYPDDWDLNGTWDFTVMAWIKTGTLDGSSVIMSKYNGTQGWKVTGNASNQVTFTLNTTSVHGNKNVADNTWHHIAASLDLRNDTVKIFVDGVLDTAIGKLSFKSTANSSSLFAGDGFMGVLDDIRYYGEAISENTMKSLYQRGYRSAMGLYQVRANNNNTVFFNIHGSPTPRYFPVFEIENYWATKKPVAGCVSLNGCALTEGVDYFATLVDENNELFIGLNTVIGSDEISLYIDDSYTKGSSMVGPTPKMNYGVNTIGTNKYVWVKNFEGNIFGSNTAKQWYINWNMSTSGTAQPSRDGEIWYMASSVEKADNEIDTSSSNLIPGDDSYLSSMGNYNFSVGGSEVKSTQHVQNAFTYAIEESSAVRVMLRINERQVVNNSQSYKIVTRWTIYPTGQFFRYDSIYQFNTAPTALYDGWFMNDSTKATVYSNKQKKRGAVLYSSGYPDFAGAWLSMKNASGNVTDPFDSDTMYPTSGASRVGFDFGDQSLPAAWNSTSIELSHFLDMHSIAMNSAGADSVTNGVQYITALQMITGTALTSTTGDLNSDGFNEREGAYTVKASSNTVNFKIYSKKDTCRYYPAIKITDYFAADKPAYVFAYNKTDTVTLLEGYQYNAYLNKTNRYLVLQIDTVFCDTTGLFISADRTLAVKMSGFSAKAGDRCDTLLWRTESEHENLGYNLYRRIKPAFYDSIASLKDSLSNDSSVSAISLFKFNRISGSDTLWGRINEKIIPGSPSGTSVGPRNYQYLDKNLINLILYEYKLESVNFSNKTEEFGPIEAMPRTMMPLAFMLKNNYPNPFRNRTIISFSLPVDATVTLNIYNLQGRLVRKLITPHKVYKAAYHQVFWDGTDDHGQQLAAGPYLYRLSSNQFMKARIMIKIQ